MLLVHVAVVSRYSGSFEETAGSCRHGARAVLPAA